MSPGHRAGREDRAGLSSAGGKGQEMEGWKGTCMQVTGGSPLAELRSQRKSPPLGHSWCLVPSRQELEETGNPAKS